MTDPDDEEFAAEARRSWAQSVQERNGDELSASLAAEAMGDSDAAQAHMGEFRRRILELSGGLIDFDILPSELSKGKLNDLDEPRVRGVVEQHVSLLVDAYVSAGKPPPLPITVSSLPSGTINAICAKDPGDGSIHIFADAELLTFVASVAKLTCSCLKPLQLGPQDFVPLKVDADRIYRDPEYRERVLDLFFASVVHGRARLSKPWIPEGMTALQAPILNWAMERFVIAHELAHAFDGHLDIDAASASGGDIQHDQLQELRADRIAVHLCDMKAIDGAYPELQATAPYIFLRAVALLEESQGKLAEAATRVGFSHPPTPERLEQLRQEYLASSGNDEHKLVRLRVLFELDRLFEAWRRVVLQAFHVAKIEGLAPLNDRKALRPGPDRPAILGD